MFERNTFWLVTVSHIHKTSIKSSEILPYILLPWYLEQHFCIFEMYYYKL